MNDLPLAVFAAGLAICCLAVSSLSAATEPRKPGSCVLSIGGKTVTSATHAIATPDKPTPRETFAAADLAEHIRLLTGQRLAVVSESDLPGAKTPLVVGQCEALLKKLKVDADIADLGEEGIVIRSAGPALETPRPPAEPPAGPRGLRKIKFHISEAVAESVLAHLAIGDRIVKKADICRRAEAIREIPVERIYDHEAHYHRYSCTGH